MHTLRPAISKHMYLLHPQPSLSNAASRETCIDLLAMHLTLVLQSGSSGGVQLPPVPPLRAEDGWTRDCTT